jgi:hypothetical protein
MQAFFLAAATKTPLPAGAPAHVTDAAFTAAQSLTTLLTTESLLFAAFNAGVVLTAPAAAGRRITPLNAYRLAKTSVVALAVVAFAAALAWWQVFGDDWPDSNFRQFEGLGIAIAILVQPIVAAIVARSGRPQR